MGESEDPAMDVGRIACVLAEVSDPVLGEVVTGEGAVDWE